MRRGLKPHVTSGLMSGEGKPPAACRSRSSALPRLYQPKTASRCICVNGMVRDAVVVANPACKKVRICGLFRGFCRLSLRAARSHDPVGRADCEDAYPITFGSGRPTIVGPAVGHSVVYFSP